MAEKKIKTPAELQKEANAAEIKKNGFLNPFSKGVTYPAFLKTLKDGEKVEEVLKGKISKNQLEWLLKDLQNLK